MLSETCWSDDLVVDEMTAEVDSVIFCNLPHVAPLQFLLPPYPFTSPALLYL